MIHLFSSFKKGFTVIELMLYMGIFSVLIAVLSGIFLSIMELQLSTHSTSQITQNANFIFSRLHYDLYRTSAVSIPGLAGETSDNLSINIAGQNYTYSLSGSDLIMVNPSGSYSLNSNDVSITGFSVTRLGSAGNDNINIDLTLQSNVTPLNKSPETVSFSQSFTLR